MRRVRNLVVVVCSAIAVWVLQVQVLGQFGTCTAGWSSCSGGNCESPAVTVPSCNSLCLDLCCSTFSGIDAGPGCGNPGAGGCAIEQVWLYKSCPCDGRCSQQAGGCTPDGADCSYSTECCSGDCAWGVCFSTPLLINLKNNSRRLGYLVDSSRHVGFEFHQGSRPAISFL